MTEQSAESARTPDGPGPTPKGEGVGPDHLRAVLQDQARTTSGPGPLDSEVEIVPPRIEARDDWEQRLRDAVAATVRRRTDRRRQRQQLDAARTYGLKRRHHTKLNAKDKP